MSRKPIAGRVSVVVTHHNRASFILPCLDSLIAQSYRHLEIIVVDDHSTDHSFRTIRQWRQSLPDRWRHRIHVLSLPRNVGYAGALTTAMFLARGEFIAIQDGDDLSHPDRIREQVRYLRRHPRIGAVGCQYATLRENQVDPSATSNWLVLGERQIREVYRRGGHCVSVPTLLFRAKYFHRYGGLTNRLHGAEDYELVANWIKKGVRVNNLNRVLYTYRVHGQQRSRKFYGSTA